MTASSRPRGDIAHATLSVLFIALLGVCTFWVLSPFLTSLLWAIVICIAIWPMLLRLEAFLGGRRWAAVAIMTATILLVVFVPVTLALTTIVSNAQNITAELKSFESVVLPAPPGWIERIPFGGDRIVAEWRRVVALDPQQRSAELTPYVQTALQWFVFQAGSVGRMLVQFLLAAVITAIGFAKGEAVRDGILRFAARLGGEQGRETAVLAARTVRGVVLGVVVTALIQAAIAGTGLFISGVPAAALLTAVILFLCLAQLGPLLVVIPAVIWLFWSGRTGAGITLLVVGVIAGALDNIVRPVLIRRGADLPLLLIFAGVIGGLIAFGIIGLFIGPVVLAVAYTLLTIWMSSVPSRDSP
ncbi:MAG TPA: AI-2E family transporter YdiK [Vicinamibacterales bacterium]|nr:AI-2E family transporter YdiK [Vicinamibacterales bacterium]